MRALLLVAIIAAWLLATVLVLFGVTVARAHSWYDPWCCNENDCKAVAPDEVTARPDGYHYRQWVVPYKDARVSADRDYHACEYPAGTMRCFYAPAGGV